MRSALTGRLHGFDSQGQRSGYAIGFDGSRRRLRARYREYVSCALHRGSAEETGFGKRVPGKRGGGLPTGEHNAALQQPSPSPRVGLGRSGETDAHSRNDNGTPGRYFTTGRSCRASSCHRVLSSPPRAGLPTKEGSDGNLPARLARLHARSRRSSRGWLAPTLIGSAAALGTAALYNIQQSRAAEREHPPIGRFLTVDGVRLHYIERGQASPCC